MKLADKPLASTASLRFIALAALLSASFVGCHRFAGPDGRSPGTLLNQQFRATLHDPYPDQDAGPEMTGVRPPLFREPLPEPVRTRGLQDEWWWAP